MNESLGFLSAMSLSCVCEYPIRMQKGRVRFPDIRILETRGQPVARAGEWKAVLTVEDSEVTNFIEWVADTMPGRCVIRGVYAWERFDFTIKRKFLGLVVYFRNAVDAVHFRLTWSDFYAPA